MTRLANRYYLPGAFSRIPMRRDSQRLPGTIWGVTTYFNPAGYSNKRDNFVTFARAIRKQGLPLLTVEAAFGNSPFTIDGDLSDRVIRVRVSDVLWLKECLVNLGVRSLPQECDKVVWIDADVLLGNEAWVATTSELLQDYVAIQPFSTAHWLKRGITYSQFSEAPPTRGDDSELFRFGTAYEHFRNHDVYKVLGHMGFAWSTRRYIFEECPLYDCLVVGGGDYLAVSAMYGLASNAWLSYIATPQMTAHIEAWMMKFHELIRGSVSFVPGQLLHLWHGDRTDRQYLDRFRILVEEGFDPIRDLERDSYHCIRWAKETTNLKTRIVNYFAQRNEE